MLCRCREEIPDSCETGVLRNYSSGQAEHNVEVFFRLRKAPDVECGAVILKPGVPVHMIEGRSADSETDPFVSVGIGSGMAKDSRLRRLFKITWA